VPVAALQNNYIYCVIRAGLWQLITEIALFRKLIAILNGHNTLHYNCENVHCVKTSVNKVDNTVHYKYSFACSYSIIHHSVLLWLFVTGYDCPCSVE